MGEKKKKKRREKKGPVLLSLLILFPAGKGRKRDAPRDDLYRFDGGAKKGGKMGGKGEKRRAVRLFLFFL